MRVLRSTTSLSDRRAPSLEVIDDGGVAAGNGGNCRRDCKIGLIEEAKYERNQGRRDANADFEQTVHPQRIRRAMLQAVDAQSIATTNATTGQTFRKGTLRVMVVASTPRRWPRRS